MKRTDPSGSNKIDLNPALLERIPISTAGSFLVLHAKYKNRRDNEVEDTAKIYISQENNHLTRNM